MLQPKKPKFDPSKPYEVVDNNETAVNTKPKFDPSKPFDVVKKKESTDSTSTTTEQKLDSAPTDGSLDSQKYEFKPVVDERGREVYEQDASGNLVPKKEKVLKGYASTTEERKIVFQQNREKAQKSIKPSVNLEKYQQATSIQEEKFNQIEAEIDDELNQRGFVNGLATGVKKGLNSLSNFFTTVGTFGAETQGPNFDIIPFAKEQTKAKEQLTQKYGGDASKITEEELKAATKEIVLKNRIEAVKIDKNNQFLKTLSEDDKRALELERIEQYKTISDRDKYYATEAAFLVNETEKLAKDCTVTKAIVENNKKQNIPTPQALIDYGIELELKLQNNINIAAELENKISDNEAKLGSAEEEIDFLKRNYSTKDKFINNIKLGFGDLWMNVSNDLPLLIEELDSMIFEPLRPGSDSGIMTQEEQNQFINDAIDWETAKEKTRSKIKKDVSFDNLNLSNFGQFFFQELGTQIPIFTQIALPGGIASIGMTSSSDKLVQMEMEPNQIEFKVDGKKYSGYQKQDGTIVSSDGFDFGYNENIEITSDRKKGYTPAQMIATAVGFGTAESVLGALPTKGILNRSVQAMERAGQRQLLRESGKEFIQRRAKEIGISGGIEFGSEGLNQVTQNFLDKVILGKKEVGLFDNVSHASFSGGMFGLAIPIMPTVAGLIMRPFADNKQSKVVRENLESIFNLQEQLNNGSISESSRNAINEKIAILESQNKDLLKSISKDAEKISEEVFNAVVDVNKKQELLKLQAAEIKADASLDKTIKAELIADLESEFNLLESKRSRLISKDATVLDALPESEVIKLKNKASKELIAKAKAEGKTEFNFEDAEITKKAISIYNENKTQMSTPTSSEVATPSVQSNDSQINEVNENAVVEDNNEAIPNPSQINNIEELEKEYTSKSIEELTALKKELYSNVDIESPLSPEEKILDKVIAKKFSDINAQIKAKRNEAAPANITPTDGNVQPGNNAVGEVLPEVQANDSQNVSTTSDNGGVSGKREIKLSEKGQLYTVENKDGEIIITDKKGRKPSKGTERQILEEYSKQIDFTKGQRVTDSFESSAETYIDDVAEKSQNPSEIAQAIAYVQNTDMNEGFVDPIQIAIAQAIGEKSIEPSSFRRFGDRNTITQSIAMQYFSKKGKGFGIDIIAQNVEYELYGDYNANDPRIEPQDIIDFILDNPRGAGEFLSRKKNEKINALKTAFTSVTGLPAKSQFIEKAIRQENEKQMQVLYAENSLYALSENDLISLNEEYAQFQEFEKNNFVNNEQTEQKTNDKLTEGIIDSQNNQEFSEQSSVQESRRRKTEAKPDEEVKPPTKDSTSDELLKWIDKARKDLDDFEKGNLTSVVGMPVQLAKLALDAMRVAVIAGKKFSEVIQAGLDVVKNSQWYQNLTTTEQKEVEDNFIQSLSDNNRQVQNAVNRAFSDSMTEEEAFDKFNETTDNSDKLLENKKPAKEVLRNFYRSFVKRFTDRQYTAKRLLDKSGLSKTKNLIINSHGASGKAKIVFEDAYNTIYKKLTRKDRKMLDKIIQAKRFIAIDENREARGLEPVSHPDFIDKGISQKFLDKLKKEIGDQKYADLENRANEYFKVYKKLLKDIYDNGLINKESYDSMSDIDYQPRVFLQFVTDFNGDLSEGNKNVKDSGGLSQDQVKSMSEGDASALVLNSEWLLMNSLLARTKAMANNNINKRFMTEEFPKAKKRFEAIDPKNFKNKEEKRFYNYFKELNEKVKDNPIVGFTDSGNPKYSYDKAPLNFKTMYYYVDGVQYRFFLEKELHDSWNDNLDGFLSGNAKEFISYASGAAIVKAIATGNNPAFPIVNTPRDFFFTVTFSDQYSSIVPKAMFQVAKDVGKAILAIKRDDAIVQKYFEYGGAMDFLSSQGVLKKESLLGKAIDKAVSPRSKDIAKSIFDKATLRKISTYSELMFRIGIFQRSIYNQSKDLGFKDISELTDTQQVDDIYNQAVASARGILDFNQGGSVTKDLEAFIPYINVAFQGGRTALNAFEKDPVGTTSRILQVSTIASTIPIGISLMLIGANKDDDDERSSYEIYVDAIDGVSPYQKSRYMTIFTGEKDEEGQYRYIKIAKSQELTPFMSITDNIYQNMIRSMAGREKRSAKLIASDAAFVFRSNVLPVDVSSPSAFFTRNPAIKATLTYTTGYDFFREQPLDFNLENRPAPSEGMNRKDVEDFYKKLGVEYGLSPIRSKAFVESFITSPNTNPFVGVLYGGAEAVTSDKDFLSIGKKLGEDIYKSTGKRVVGYTSDFNRQLETKKQLEEKIEKVKLEDAIQKKEFKELAEQFLNKEITGQEVREKLKKLDPEDQKRFLNKLKDKAAIKDVDRTVLDIKYERTPEIKALMIVHYYGDIFDGTEESKQAYLQMKKAGGILTPTVIKEIKKLKDEITNKKTSN